MWKWPRRVRAFGHLPFGRKALLAEATADLIVARLLVWLLPFKHIARILDVQIRPRGYSPEDRVRQRREIQRAIRHGARLLPGETVCFPQAIAAQFMCRLRGIDVTLYYGAASLPVKGLSAHVWVLDGVEGVIGHLGAKPYKVLARFPADRKHSESVPLSSEPHAKPGVSGRVLPQG